MLVDRCNAVRAAGGFRRGLRRMALALTVVTAASGVARGQEPEPDGPAGLARVIAQAHDDPRATLRQEQARAARADITHDQRFWSLLAVARVRTLLEQPVEAAKAMKAADAALAALASAGPVHRAARDIEQLYADRLVIDQAALRPRVAALQVSVAGLGQPRLDCEVQRLHSWTLTETIDPEEAFRAAQAHEQCAAALGDVEMMSNARVILGALTTETPAGKRDPLGALQHFGGANDALGMRPARYLRSVIEWYTGRALQDGQPGQALVHLERARTLSLDIGDDVGVGIASTDMAQIHLRAGRPAQALALARAARDRFMRAEAGDATLRAFADVARATLRTHDRFGRYGGEEWLLVLPGAGPEEVGAVFRRLRERLVQTAIDGLPMPHGVTFSMGAAFDDGAAAGLQDVIRLADERMYRAKSEGRDRWVAG